MTTAQRILDAVQDLDREENIVVRQLGDARATVVLMFEADSERMRNLISHPTAVGRMVVEALCTIRPEKSFRKVFGLWSRRYGSPRTIDSVYMTGAMFATPKNSNLGLSTPEVLLIQNGKIFFSIEEVARRIETMKLPSSIEKTLLNVYRKWFGIFIKNAKKHDLTPETHAGMVYAPTVTEYTDLATMKKEAMAKGKMNKRDT